MEQSRAIHAEEKEATKDECREEAEDDGSSGRRRAERMKRLRDLHLRRVGVQDVG